jgi:hypothetical protein
MTDYKKQFPEFRSNMLQSIGMLSEVQKNFMRGWSKDDIEDWVKKEYLRHYGRIDEGFDPLKPRYENLMLMGN